mgnify:CR=1 FL=1
MDASTATQNSELRERVISTLKGIYDPEIPVNIYDLGLIYEVTVHADDSVHILMTLTAPGCPVAQTFPGNIEATVANTEGVAGCTVELTWEPAWTKECMSDDARALLNFG